MSNNSDNTTNSAVSQQESSSSGPVLQIYPCMDKFVGRLVIAEGDVKHLLSPAPAKETPVHNMGVQTVFMCDRSGSMQKEVTRLLTRIFPGMLKQLGCTSNQFVQVVLFDSPNQQQLLQTTVAELSTNPVIAKISSRGSTHMSSGISLLEKA